MKPIYREIIIIIVSLSLGYSISKFILTHIRGSDYNVVKYSCDIAEFHPDYPLEVRQKCRELKNENSTSK